MKTKKQRIHKISDSKPVLAGILNAVVCIVLFQLMAGIFQALLLTVANPGQTPYGAIPATFIMLYLYKRWYRPEFEGALSGGHPEYGLKLGLPILINWVTVPFMFILTPLQFGMPTVVTVTTSLVAGCMEETVFRSAVISTIMRKCRSERTIMTAVIVSSVLFGLAHAVNGVAGANIGATILQMFEAGLLGLFLGALYLRCGNLWPCIIIHAVNDIIAMTNVSDITENGIVTGGLSWWSGVDFATCLAIGIIGIRMIRPEVRADIMEIWKKKWTVPVREESE